MERKHSGNHHLKKSDISDCSEWPKPNYVRTWKEKNQKCSKNTTKWKIKKDTLCCKEKWSSVQLKRVLSIGSRIALTTFDKDTTSQDKLKVSIAGRFFTQTKITQKVLNFDSVGHLGDKSTFKSVC